MAKEQQQQHCILCLCLYLYLYHVLLREVMQQVAEPDELEDFGTVLVLVLVQMQVQVEVQEQVEEQPVAEPDHLEGFDTVLVLVQKQIQAEGQGKGQQRVAFLGKVLANWHTAVPNEEPNSGKREQVDAQWQGA
jgi:hypothetical protein